MFLYIVVIWLCSFSLSVCDLQDGPDPWYHHSKELEVDENDVSVPPDLRRNPFKTEIRATHTTSPNEWFFKRFLAIILKGGQTSKNEDNSMEVSVQMHISEEHWELLNSYITSGDGFSEDMYRKTLAYVEEAIYKPTFRDRIVMAWTDYVHYYLMEYKMLITWIFGAAAFIMASIFLLHHVSYKHIGIIVFIFMYLYEVLVSYKETEQKEYERFVSAINACNWKFWSSSCDVPPIDALAFIKHMHPMKIGIRIITMFVTEPMIAFSSTTKVIVDGMTDGLFWPMDMLASGLLIVLLNVVIIILLIMILFNFIFNTPFSFLGLISIGVNRYRRTIVSSEEPKRKTIQDTADRLSGENVNKFLNMCTQAINNANSTRETICDKRSSHSVFKGIKKSASAGRLNELTFKSMDIGKVAKPKQKSSWTQKKKLLLGAGDS